MVDNPGTWLALFAGLAAIARGEWQAWQARVAKRELAASDLAAAHEKSEAERLAALDKMQFGAELQKLKADHATCALENERRKEAEVATNAALAKCADQHAASELDRAEMKGRLAVMESLVKAQQAK